jgi:hypothetical protein
MTILLSRVRGDLALHPEAAGALVSLEQAYGVSVPLAVTCAVPLAPGVSPHDYGLAIEVDAAKLMEILGLTKTGLDALMEQFGWYCHRRDGASGAGDGHYNYLGTHPEEYLHRAGVLSTAGAAEALLQALYGDEMENDRGAAFSRAERQFVPLIPRPTSQPN